MSTPLALPPTAVWSGDTLFFPVTAFGADGRVDPACIAAFVADRLATPVAVGALFAACGTGEFHALSADEVAVVAAAVVAAAGGRPVFVGAGGPLGHALACSEGGAASGASAVLLMPPYLVDADADGFVAFVRTFAERSPLPAIVYHRVAGLLDATSVDEIVALDGVVGVKDGVGDVALMQSFGARAAATGRADFALFNGMPFAEVHDRSYRRLGITSYSSSTYAMAPTIAGAYRRAADAGDEQRCDELLDRFFRPLDELRRRGRGYNVSLVKAAVADDGFAVGSVRPPLLAPRPGDLDDLARLLALGRQLVE